MKKLNLILSELIGTTADTKGILRLSIIKQEYIESRGEWAEKVDVIVALLTYIDDLIVSGATEQSIEDAAEALKLVHG